jgi:hypothetical protein
MKTTPLAKARYKAKTLQELEAVEKAQGYKFGWALRIYAYRINKQNRSK